MTATITYTGILSVLECGSCRISFAIPQDMLAARQRDGRDFWCPSGCKIHYSDPENTRLKRQLRSAEAQATHARDQRDAAERSARAYKGQVTKIKRRVANGVCPCCNRTFANLAEHMAGQHPDFQADGQR